MLILLSHFLLYFAIFGNFQIFRSVVGFVYLLFVPGIVALRLLKIKGLATSEKVLLSVGLSVAILMLVGLALNSLAPIVGFAFPLSVNRILLSISLIVLPLSFFSVGADELSARAVFSRVERGSLFCIAVSVFLIAIGIYGIMVLEVTGSSLLLLLLILSVAVVVFFASFSQKLVPPKFYPLILLVACAALLFFVGNDTALLTNYLTGRGDQWIEFYAFRLTDIPSIWLSTAASSASTPSLFPTYSMLSVTILPTIFERITGLDSSWIFKLLYPCIVCFMAVGAYALYRTQTENRVAFIATFFFITVSVGKGWGSDKQLVAQLFLVTLLFVIFKPGLPRLKRDVLFIILGLGLLLSHYSLSYLFMITLLFAWLILVGKEYIKKGRFSVEQQRIPLDLVLIYLTMGLSWYVYVNSSEAFNNIVQTLYSVMGNIGQFFDVRSRGTALAGLGIVNTPTILSRISVYYFFLTEVLLILGFLWVWFRKGRTTFVFEYKLIALINVLIISANLILPRLADTFLMERFYQTTLIVLAPFAVLGAKAVFDRIPRINTRFVYPIIVLLIFVPFFLFQTGFTYEVAGQENDAQTLDMHRWDNFKVSLLFVTFREVSGANWLSTNVNVSNISVLSDLSAQHNVLTGYGLIGRGQVGLLSSEAARNVGVAQFVFLRPGNVIDGKIEGYSEVFNSSLISSSFQEMDKVYSSGGCEVYWDPSSRAR